MDKQEVIKDLLKPFYDKNRFIYRELSQDEFNALETKYCVRLPDSFKWYMTEFYFDSLALEIPAKAIKTDMNGIDKLNEEYRDEKYPKELFIISHVDEYDYCFDTKRMKDGECPVVSFSRNDKEGILDKYVNFYDFLIDFIINSIDNDFFE